MDVKDVYVRHIREYDKDGKVLGKGGATVAYVQEGNRIRFAMAICSEKDSFSRKKGRTISVGRLVEGSKSISVISTWENFQGHLNKIRTWNSIWTLPTPGDKE
jgi:hypothetical protein